jgi:hypothetical protein
VIVLEAFSPQVFAGSRFAENRLQYVFKSMRHSRHRCQNWINYPLLFYLKLIIFDSPICKIILLFRHTAIDDALRVNALNI